MGGRDEPRSQSDPQYRPQPDLGKTPDQIAMMREAGKICAQILQELTLHVKPGVTSRQINDIAYDLIVNKL